MIGGWTYAEVTDADLRGWHRAERRAIRRRARMGRPVVRLADDSLIPY